MSEDAHSSGLISLLWGLWIYWIISCWCEHLLSLSRAKDGAQARQSGSPGRITPLKGSARSNLEALVSQILRRCGTISVNDFVDERLAAYETIVAAFDAGDRSTLRKLVSPEVYDVFSDAIAAREPRLETETSFSRIEPRLILAALLDEANAEISIQFVAESYKLSRNASGQVLGRPDKRHSVDIWTFGCTLTSPAKEWRLVATVGDARRAE